MDNIAIYGEYNGYRGGASQERPHANICQHGYDETHIKGTSKNLVYTSWFRIKTQSRLLVFSLFNEIVVILLRFLFSSAHVSHHPQLSI